jgi:hypothetical protein
MNKKYRFPGTEPESATLTSRCIDETKLICVKLYYTDLRFCGPEVDIKHELRCRTIK